MNWLVVSPILIPLLSAALCLVARRSLRIQRGLAMFGATALLVAALLLLRVVAGEGIQVSMMGSWPAPFGIPLVADLLAAIMVVVAGLMGFTIALFSLATIDGKREKFGYYPLTHILLAGVCGAFLTGDMFNLFVWFEVMLLASFVLLVLGGERDQMEGGIKYVTLNLFSSVIFLTAVGILYAMAGTLNMADLARKLPQVEHPGLVTTVAMLFMISFGIKAAAFPLFFWLPAAYPAPPVAVSALFAGLLTKVGVYALIRVFTLVFTVDVAYTHTILLWAAGLTMLTGVLGAAAQFEFRRILSFHSISQVGYMMMGLALFTPLALAGALLFIVHHSIVKTSLFLVSGAVYRLRGSYQLKELGGFYREAPWLALLFMVPALSLAGLPPLSGFFAKLILVQAGLEAKEYVLVAVALVVGLLTLFSMIKIWNEVFWKPQPEAGAPSMRPVIMDRGNSPLLLLIPIVGLAILTVLMGVMIQPVLDLASRAAEQLFNPAEYVEILLGEIISGEQQ